MRFCVIFLIGIGLADRRDLVHRVEEGVEQARLELAAAKLSHDGDGFVERHAGRYTRLLVSASKTSVIAAILASSGISAPCSPRG